MPLSTDIDATYPDNAARPGIKKHQEDHDALAEHYNAWEDVDPANLLADVASKADAAATTAALAGKQATIPAGTYAGIGAANTLTGANHFRGVVTNRAADTSEIITKPLGDGSSGLRNIVNDDTVGYLDHLHTGPNSGPNSGCIGIGTDFGSGNGLLVSVKAAGYGVAVALNPSATGSGLNVLGYSSANFPARFDLFTGSKPVLFYQQSGAGFGDGVVTAGSPVLTSATAAFVAGDVGATVSQLTTRSSSPSAIPAGTTIISRESATSVTMSANATANATAMNFFVGGRTIGATTPAMTEYYGGSAAQKWIRTRLTASDAQPSFQVGINGGMDWGAGGSSAVDIDLYRATNGRLRTSKQFLADDGIGTKVVAGTVSDASFLRTPPDGQVALDSSGSKIWVRMAGAWKSVAVA